MREHVNQGNHYSMKKIPLYVNPTKTCHLFTFNSKIDLFNKEQNYYLNSGNITVTPDPELPGAKTVSFYLQNDKEEQLYHLSGSLSTPKSKAMILDLQQNRAYLIPIETQTPLSVPLNHVDAKTTTELDIKKAIFSLQKNQKDKTILEDNLDTHDKKLSEDDKIYADIQEKGFFKKSRNEEEENEFDDCNDCSDDDVDQRNPFQLSDDEESEQATYDAEKLEAADKVAGQIRKNLEEDSSNKFRKIEDDKVRAAISNRIRIAVALQPMSLKDINSMINEHMKVFREHNDSFDSIFDSVIITDFNYDPNTQLVSMPN